MIENIVRALIIRESRILLARQIGHDYTFLPGGHIEHGEISEIALKRELLEELNMNGNCGNYLCTIENIFKDNSGKSCHEVGLYFMFEPDAQYADEDFISKEAHLEFIWADIDELDSFNLKPVVAVDIIRDLFSGYEIDNLYSEVE